jgi:hypothetical protein
MTDSSTNGSPDPCPEQFSGSLLLQLPKAVEEVYDMMMEIARERNNMDFLALPEEEKTKIATNYVYKIIRRKQQQEQNEVEI